jgi:hypothetical protein
VVGELSGRCKRISEEKELRHSRSCSFLYLGLKHSAPILDFTLSSAGPPKIKKSFSQGFPPSIGEGRQVESQFLICAVSQGHRGHTESSFPPGRPGKLLGSRLPWLWESRAGQEKSMSRAEAQTGLRATGDLACTSLPTPPARQLGLSFSIC